MESGIYQEASILDSGIRTDISVGEVYYFWIKVQTEELWMTLTFTWKGIMVHLDEIDTEKMIGGSCVLKKEKGAFQFVCFGEMPKELAYANS